MRFSDLLFLSGPLLDHVRFLLDQATLSVERVPDVDVPVVAYLEVVPVEVPRRRPRDVLAVDGVDPAVARAKKLPLTLPHDPAHRAPQMRARAGEDVEVLLGLLDLLLSERPAVVVFQKGGAVALPVRAAREDLDPPRSPDGALHHELLVGDLLGFLLAVYLLDRKVHPEVLRLFLRDFAYRTELQPLVGHVRLLSNVDIDDRPQDERRRRNSQYRPDYSPEDTEAQKVLPGNGIFLQLCHLCKPLLESPEATTCRTRPVASHSPP